ncbi:pyridoxine 5'-phosphate synthase [Lentisphaerota bacterium WC36G]|nr:pyridoxine 5'-phosphate synthase [Lentisphaerae bacterium WC36]
MLKLGVNIDHVATLRQARLGVEPRPLEAALICEEAGAWGITAHLREDRRHIQDADMVELVENVQKLNMEMALTDEMLQIATKLKPNSCCIVPEKRQELTTEGGLEVVNNFENICAAVKRLHDNEIIVSLFIDPVAEQIAAAVESGAEYIELHTGTFANTKAGSSERKEELSRLMEMAEYATNLGLKVNAGHGIDYENIEDILKIPHLHELNIGHSIVSHAVMVGMKQAVSEMIDLMKKY